MPAPIRHLVLVDLETTRSPQALVATFRYYQGGYMRRGRLWLCPRLARVSPEGSLYQAAMAALDALDADSAYLTDALRA